MKLKCLPIAENYPCLDRIFMSSGTPAAGAGPAVHTGQPEAQAESGQEQAPSLEDRRLERKSPEELKSELKRDIDSGLISGSFTEAEKVLRVMENNPQIRASEKEDFRKLVEASNDFLRRREPILSSLKDLGKTSFADTAGILSAATNLQKDIGGTLRGLAIPGKETLERHLQDLVTVARESDTLKKTLDEVVAMNEDFLKGNLNMDSMLNRWSNIRNRFQAIRDSTRNLLSEYASIPFVATNILEGANNLSGLVQYLTFMQQLDAYGEVREQVPDMASLERKLSVDFDTHVTLEPGAIFCIDGKNYRVEDVYGNGIRVYGSRQKLAPYELYMAFLIASGYGTLHTDKKIGGGHKDVTISFVPGINNVNTLQQRMGLDAKEKLEKDVLLRTYTEAEVWVDNIDPVNNKITILHSPLKDKKNPEEKVWKAATLSFQEFYGKWWVKKNMHYIGKEGNFRPHTVSTSPMSETGGKKSVMPHLISVAGVVQAVKWIASATGRMSKERTEVDASNLSKEMAKGLDNIPWWRGIHNISVTSNHGTVLGLVTKWAEEYEKTLRTAALDVEWKRFKSQNKIRQAGLLLAAAKRGISEEEVFWLLGGPKDIWPSHIQYVLKVKDYFCSGSDGLPDKVESALSKAIGEGFTKEAEKGWDDCGPMADPEEVLEQLRDHAGEVDYKTGKPKQNKWKRIRLVGDTISLLKLMCDARQLGVAQLWHFRALENDAQGYGNNWTEEMMRQMGNMGKYRLPMLGLFRLPHGMAIMKTLIEFFTRSFGADPFQADSEAETIMALMMVGRFQQAVNEHDLENRVGGKDNFERLKFLYYKARMMAINFNEGAPLGMDYGSKDGKGRELDESTLNDAYGVGGLMSAQWLKTVLNCGADHKPDHKWEKQTSYWWQNFNKDFKNVTPDECRIFAKNFAIAFAEQAPQAQQWYWANYSHHYPDKILEVYGYLKIPPGHKIQWKDTTDPNKYKEADKISDIAEFAHDALHKNDSYKILDIVIGPAILDATIEACSNTVKQFYVHDQPNGDLDLQVKKAAAEVMKESEDPYRYERTIVTATQDDVNRQIARAKVAASDKGG